MIKSVMVLTGRRVLLIGLSRANIDRLHLGMPIYVDLEVLTTAAGGAPLQDLIVIAGATEEAIVADLQRTFPELTAPTDSAATG
jgi:hypothetical protein